MFDHIIVPLDGSEESARALRPASAIARYLDVEMEAVAYHDPGFDGVDLEQLVARQVAACGDVRRSHSIAPMMRPVAELVAEVAAGHADPLMVMSTRGHGRTAAVIGSVATEILQVTHQPVLLIGPKCDVGTIRLHGDMVVPVDAGEGTDVALDLAAAMAATFDYRPVVVNVVDNQAVRELAKARSAPGGDVGDESAMAHRVAARLGEAADVRGVEYEVLHGKTAGGAIVHHLDHTDTTLVVMATHARTGFGLLRTGSETATVVGRATCPVLAVSAG